MFLIVTAIEFTRRAAREYDRKILGDHRKKIDAAVKDDLKSLPGSVVKRFKYVLCQSIYIYLSTRFRPTVQQQAVRSFFHFVQFSAGYILMLMAMYVAGFLTI